jgi:hypothetical protein
MGDDACTAGLSFSLGGDGQADLVAVVAELCAGGGIFFQLCNKGFQIFFKGPMFFCQGFEFPFKKGSG